MEAYRPGIAFRQALLYAPFKLVWQHRRARHRTGAHAEAPVIYMVAHQSRLDPALMLALLPEETLHILDEDSARSVWLEPWRELAPHHCLQCRACLLSAGAWCGSCKGKGRLAVYFPDAVEPDAKAFRLYRAVAQIASQGRRQDRADRRRRRAPLAVVEHAGRQGAAPMVSAPAIMRARTDDARASLPKAPSAAARRAANALFDRLAEARVAAGRSDADAVPGDARRGDRRSVRRVDHRGRDQRRR